MPKRDGLKRKRLDNQQPSLEQRKVQRSSAEMPLGASAPKWRTPKADAMENDMSCTYVRA